MSIKKSIAFDFTPIALKRLGRSYRTGIYRYSTELTKRLTKCPDYDWHFINYSESAKEPLDLYHGLFHAMTVPKNVQKQASQIVVTIHDLISWIHPEFFPLHSLDPLKIEKTLEEEWFICPSWATKEDIIEHFGVHPSRIFVTPLAACSKTFYPNKNLQVLQKYGLKDEPYFFFVGRLEERKGVHLLLNAFKEFVFTYRIKDLKLVLSGPLASNYPDLHQSMQPFLKNNYLKGRIIHIPFIEDADLSAFYSGALAFVFLSFYEGFGLPLLEAMQCACPVLSFDNSSLKEVVKDSGYLIDTSHEDEIVKGLSSYYFDSSFREEKSSKALERSKDFSWEITTEETLKAYESILGKSISKIEPLDPSIDQV